MTTKLEELRNKHKVNKESLANAGSTSQAENFLKAYKLQPGKNKFRAVPFEDGSIVKKVSVHMNLGVPFLCPKKHGNEYCPSCDFGWTLFNEAGKKHTKDAKGNDISKSFLSQDKFVFQGIFRAEEENDIKEFGYPRIRFNDCSPTLATALIAYFEDKDKEYGDVADLFEGTDIILTKDADKAKARQQSVSSELARKTSPVISLVPMTDDKFVTMVESMFENAPKMEERFVVKSANEIRELMAKFKNKVQSKEENELADEAFSSGTSQDFEDAASSVDIQSEEELKDLF